MDTKKTEYILSPADISPSRPDFKVIGVFNPGVTFSDGRFKILVRVSETIKETREGQVCLFRANGKGGIETHWVNVRDLKRVDPHMVVINDLGCIRLSFISHLRLVTSSHGVNIDEIDPQPTLYPIEIYEEFGVEDARITRIGDTYYITYVGISRNGIATALVSTNDFRTYERHGIIFPPENKDVVLFPDKIKGKYWAIHRPYTYTRFSMPEMWLSSSPDLLNWGDHRFLLGGLEPWETERVGAGPPPILTDYGWLVIYHGVHLPKEHKGVGVYSVGGILLDCDDPRRIIARAKAPLMVPEAGYERITYVPDVIFPTGIVQQEEDLLIYHGTDDAHTCVTICSLSQLCEHIQNR